MSLSINKLEHLLAQNGFVPIKYFVINSYCAYIETISIKNASTFIMSIPSKYKFKLREGDNVHKLRYIEIETGINTADEYAGAPDSFELEKSYTEVELKQHLLRKKENEEGNIAGHLEEGYKRLVSVKDMNKDDMKDIRNLIRQIRRLKLCVQSISYKIMIMYKSYMCVLDRDDTIQCFMIKHHTKIASRRLYVTCDLELYYENSERIQQDIVDVLNGINNVLNKNQATHARNLQTLLLEYQHINIYSDKVLKKKKEYQLYILKFTTLLLRITNAEKTLIEQIYNIDNKNEGSKGMQGDMSIIHQKTKLESELIKISDVKKNIARNMNDIREKLDNLSLIMDTVMFDDIVMCDRMIRNLDFIKRVTKHE